MKPLTNYLKNNNIFNNIDESLNNNVRMINESQLIIEHGKDIDNLLYKVKVYTNNYLHNRINESQNNYKLSLSEQIAARDLFIYCLEDYKESLLNECSVYENLLNNTISINEAEFQLGSVVKNLWNQGKDKVEKIYNDAKTKIQEINELIKAFAEKSIKSLKEFANKIVETLDKLGDSLFKIANKIGFGKDKVTEISDELIEDIKNNPEKITKNDIFESLGKDINEGIVDWVQNSKAGKWYAEKKQKPLWNAFFQFCNWLLVCKVLPAVVLAVFPGSILYYIVSIAIKVIWNIKKIKGLIKQTQDYVHSWNTMTNWQRIWKAAVLLFMWYLWFHNVVSIAGNASKVGDALKKSLEDGEFWKQMFGKAHTGIEPDKLEAMGAAVIRWIGKGFEGSISDAYNEIMDACKESMGVEAYEAAKKAIEEGKAAAEAAKKTMENTESLTKQIEDEVKNFNGEKSTSLLKKIKALCTLSADELKDKLTYRVWVDGTATTKAAWLKKLIEEAKAAGMDDSIIQKTQDMMNDSLHKVNSNAGSVSFMELPGEMIKFAAGKKLLGKNEWFGIIGEIAKEVKDAGGDLPAVVSAFSAAMSSDVPIITFKQKGNGFRVRLGDEKSKNYIYEVGKDDVKFIKPSEIDNDKVKKAYEKIKEVINTENKNFIDKILNSDLKEDEKKKIKKRVEEFNDSYSDELSKTPLVVIYGSQIDKETQNKYDGKESLKSLHDYLIYESEEDDQKEDTDQKENTKEEDNTGHQPVLIFSNVYGMDIADANEKGPRKEIYSLKGAFHSLQFIEIKKGMNLHDIQEMLGEWMHTMVNNLCNVAVISPFEKKKSWWKDKFIPSKNLKENEERREFGNLTNGEIADIMNKKENAKNYVLSKTNSISIIQDESDKKYEEDKKKEYGEKLKNADEETIKAVKEIDPDAVGEDGKIKPEKIEDISKKASSYKLAQHKSKNTKKGGGFWSKLKNFVKGIFGGNKKEGKNYNKLLNHIDPETNEGLNEYDNLDLFLEEMFKPKTLSEYIMERKL